MGQHKALFRAIGTKSVQVSVSRVGKLALVVGAGLVVANCGATSTKITSKVDPKYGVTASPRVVAMGQPVPKGGGAYRVGKPYQVAGKTYVPEENTRYKREGLASWYGDDFHGRLTANGEVFDMESIAAAHPTLPMPSYVRVTNLDNRKSLIVRVNDRGPYHSDRVIDVSRKAADLLGFQNRGTARVKVEYVGRAPLEGSDDRKLIATLRNDGSSPMPVNSAVQVASNGDVPTSRMPVANVPSPPDRPFDLGSNNGAQVAVAAPQVARAPAPVVVASAPRAVAAPLPVATAPKPAPALVAVAANPRPVAVQRPVQVASAPVAVQPAAPQPVVQYAPAATGWVVGPQPVAGYAAAGVLTPVGTGRGLY